MSDKYLQVARDLLDQEGLSNWRVQVSHGKRTVGYCHYGKRSIFLSKHHMEHDTETAVHDTIYHEVAHALNPGDSHGPEWRATAQRLGGSGNQYHKSEKSYPSKWMTQCIEGHSPEVYRWNMKTVYTCSQCGGLIYFLRSDGTPIQLGPGYVEHFNSLADMKGQPRIKPNGRILV